MSIVCGTDFSEMATHAATVAACVAARTGQILHLVHALYRSPDELKEHPGHPLKLQAESRLAHEAERLHGLGADVHVQAVAGTASDAVQTAAHERDARLIVVGAPGEGESRSRKLGGRADRVAQHSRLPVLTVRDSSGFVAWSREGRPLRVVLGIDASVSAENAARWLDELCQVGAVELTLAHLYWPPEAFNRLGLEGIRSMVEPDAEIVKTLERQFAQRFDSLLHAKPRSYRVEPHLGRVGDALAGLAAEVRADLLVIGCRAAGAFERLREGSVAQQALQAARLSVACVPAPVGARVLPTPRLENVLAATDFSELGDRAIPFAYAAANPGGTVHLLHVIKNGRRHLDPHDIFRPAADAESSDASAAASARLSQLVPPDASAKRVSTEVHVLETHDPSEAICQAGERLGIDLICLGTHGRSGLAKAALGSVAAHVCSNSRRPLLLVRGPKP